MQKKSVLGTDPFKWIKEDNKKESTETLKSDIVGQGKQTDKPLNSVDDNNETGVKHKAKQEEKTYKPVDVSEALKLKGNKVHGPGNVTKSYNLQEDKTIEPSDISEVNRKAVLGTEAYDYHAKPRETTQKESPATAFVIVYTVLLLILGFIIYRDMTKQIDRLETKLETIEKQLDAGLINYEDTKLDDVW